MRRDRCLVAAIQAVGAWVNAANVVAKAPYLLHLRIGALLEGSIEFAVRVLHADFNVLLRKPGKAWRYFMFTSFSI